MTDPIGVVCDHEHGCITCGDEAVADARRAGRRGAGAGAVRERGRRALERRDRRSSTRSATATACSSMPARAPGRWIGRSREVRRRVPRRRARPGAGRRDPGDRRAGPPLQGDGGLRRPHALDLQVRDRRPAARERRARARARLPGVRDPDGPRRRRHRHRPRAGRDLHLLRRHAARPGLATGRCSRPRPRAPTCGWSTRRSTRCASPSENPDREVVFFAIGFETTAPSTALTLKRAKAEGVPNFSCVCNHVTIVPPLRALLESPDLRLDGFIGPGPRVHGRRRPAAGVHPRRLRAPGGHLRLRAARHPAVDPDDPAPARRRAAARSRTSTSASCPTRATCARSRSWPRCSSCARTSSGAASASSPRAR